MPWVSAAEVPSKPQVLARVLQRILAATLWVPCSGLSSACGSGANGPSTGSGSGDSTGTASSGGGSSGASTGSDLTDASTGSTDASGSQSGSSGGSSGSQSGSSGNPGRTGSADGGFGCNTQASPNGCNCPNAGASFAYTLSLQGAPGACGLSAISTQNSQALCGHLCGGCFSPFGSSCQLTTPDSGASVQCNATCPPAGRRPPGLAPFSDAPGAALGCYFARCAHLEAASVAAFRVLRGELARHEAPAWMLRATERAARDETRHARATERIARRYGGSPRRPRIQRSPPRSLEALAIDNAIEGCVRETYGAVVAMWQAQKANDPKVRAAMDRIARDETRHAALSWQIARWAERRLEAKERARVERARRMAISELHRELTREPDAALIHQAGLPRAHQALLLLASLNRELWSGESQMAAQ